MNEFGYVLTRIAEEPIAALFKRRIADPIRMNPERWRWGVEARLDGLDINGGAGNHSAGLHISASEIARFGHLFLNEGLWDGRRLISREWVAMASRVQVPSDLPLERLSGADGRGVCGFNWWVNGIGAKGERKWPGAPERAFSASGYNNNDMFVVPEWEMVVVRLGLDQKEKAIDDATYGEFLRQIGEAIF
ncbi:MAG: hypothetical protein BWZ10_03146 [candidate division BRC1 bacterium ADurb.BinA364]|nr:MAG: hypothetical protein BWZ10_03146 [candidate division BRC1 bacterium ADurb.BinA364]